MKYRDVDYTITQGVGRQIWQWDFILQAKAVNGRAMTKSEAIAEAERAIDRALAAKKLRLVRPKHRD